MVKNSVADPAEARRRFAEMPVPPAGTVNPSRPPRASPAPDGRLHGRPADSIAFFGKLNLDLGSTDENNSLAN